METIISLVLLCLFIGPIIFLIYKQVGDEKLFRTKAKEYGIEPKITELNKAFLLGLDMKKKKLLVIIPFNQQSYLISLVDIEICELRTENRKHLPGKINFISLVLHYKRKEHPPFEIVFYDLEDSNPEAEMPLQLAQNWEKIIQKQLLT